MACIRCTCNTQIKDLSNAYDVQTGKGSRMRIFAINNKSFIGLKWNWHLAVLNLDRRHKPLDFFLFRGKESRIGRYPRVMIWTEGFVVWKDYKHIACCLSEVFMAVNCLHLGLWW